MSTLSLALSIPLSNSQSDAELLTRYLRDRDADSFTAIVKRYGPLVLGVCRRKIPDRHLADDAFQAAFLVLSQKAETIRPAGNLPNWLYGVSIRIAMRARAMAAKRAKRETTNTDFAETVQRESATHEDVSDLLDHAISQLPEPLREAVLLCELNGLSRRDASRRLGIPEGTLSSRLASARKRLAEILKRRDVVLPAGTLAATALVPGTLVRAAVNAAMNPEPLSTTVHILAKAGVSMLVVQKLKYSLVALLALCALTGGLSFAMAQPVEPGEASPFLVTAKRDPIIKDNVWDRFQRICGSGEASRKLFDEMMKDQEQAKAIREADKSDEAAFAMYSKSGTEIDKQWIDFFTNQPPMPAGPESTAIFQKQSLSKIPRSVVLQQLFLGSRKVPSKSKDLDKTVINTAAFVDLMKGAEKEPARKLYLAWLEQRTDPRAYQQGLRGSLYVEIKEVVPFVRKRIVQPNEHASAIGNYLLILGNRGETSDTKLLEKYLDDKTTYQDLTYKKSNNNPLQLRDIATAMILKVHGADLDQDGFDTMQYSAWWCGKDPAPFIEPGAFPSEGKRENVFEQFKKWRTENEKKKK